MAAELGSTGHADRLRLSPVKAAGRTAIDGTAQFLAQHPNLGSIWHG